MAGGVGPGHNSSRKCRLGALGSPFSGPLGVTLGLFCGAGGIALGAPGIPGRVAGAVAGTLVDFGPSVATSQAFGGGHHTGER